MISSILLREVGIKTRDIMKETSKTTFTSQPRTRTSEGDSLKKWSALKKTAMTYLWKECATKT